MTELAEFRNSDARRHVPGWLLKLLDGDDRGSIEYAARNCSTRYYIRLLSQRADELLERENGKK